MTSKSPESGEPTPDSFSVADVLLGAAQRAIRDSASECSRAEGNRGIVYLNVELCLGDRGEPLWLNSNVYFSQKRHQKDARENNLRG